MWCAARNPCDAGQVGADRGKIGGKDWQCRMMKVWTSHSSHHFLMVRGLGGRPAQLDLVDRNSLSPARCRLGRLTGHSLCTSQRPARVTPAYPATVLRPHHVAPHPVSLRRSCGAAAEGCVTITVHVPTPCRCSLLAASDPLSRSLTASVVGCFT